MKGAGFGGTRADEVVAIIEYLEARSIAYQINGGWAVDALAGVQTRSHRDVDVFVDADRVRELDAWLIERGYRVDADWDPVRVEWVAGDQRVDVHPMVLAENGDGVQRGFGDEYFLHLAADRAQGRIAGHPVVIANRRRLHELREGYPPRVEDVHDLEILRGQDGDVVEFRFNV